MNKRSELDGVSGPPPGLKGVRAAGKARSRQSLLEAGKRLFMERGYEAATVRDIAAAAGLSTGAVFASFTDKADLFAEVLRADAAGQMDAMRQAVSSRGSAAERLLALLCVGYAHHLPQLQLLRAAVGVSWSQGLDGPLGDRPVREPVVQLIGQVLAEDGKRSAADAELIAESLWDLYIAGYRHLLYGGADLEALKTRLGRQIALLLAGRAG